jgi:transcriptional regulator with XRE-family HTH domain
MTRGSHDGPHPVDRYVGRRVWEKRVAMGHNQSDLARALGITFQQVQKYEKGTNRISSSKLWEIARFLQVDVGYFFIGYGAPALDAVESADEHVGLPTRYSLEIGRLAPQLSTRRQKLALDIIQSLKSTRAELDD